MHTVISFSNHKGGTGKTTSTLNIACALRNQHKRVLVIDLDPQSNLTYSLGLKGFPHTVADWLLNDLSAEACILQSEGISVLPASVAMGQVQEQLHDHAPGSNLLKQKLGGLPFDFILIDCPPAMGAFTNQALTASDYVIVPMLLEILSIRGLSQIIGFIEQVRLTTNPQLEILGVLGVCVNESRKLTNEVLAYIDAKFAVNVFNNRVHSNVKAAEAPSFARSVVDYAPRSTSAKDYQAVTLEVLKRLEAPRLSFVKQ